MPSQTFSHSTQSPPLSASAQVREREFFDSLVRDNGDFNPFADRGWKTIEKRFVGYLGNPKVGALLDIGCGTGESRRIYINHVNSYTGVDLSPQSIETAQRRFPQSNWEVADACQLSFAANQFDAVAFSSVLHHIDDYSIALKEAYRVVKPGGLVFAFDPNVWHPALGLLRHPHSPFYISEGVSPNERPLRPVKLRDAFSTAGFQSIQQRCQSDIPYRAVAPKLINACLSIYNVADRVWEISGMGRWFGTFVVTAGRKPLG